jgi:hypothetical protein
VRLLSSDTLSVITAVHRATTGRQLLHALRSKHGLSSGRCRRALSCSVATDCGTIVMHPWQASQRTEGEPGVPRLVQFADAQPAVAPIAAPIIG